MQRSRSFYLACNPYGTINCQQDRKNGCTPGSNLIDNVILRRWTPYVAGEQKQNRIEDEDEDEDQNVSQQEPTLMHMREMGFHVHTSCSIELARVERSALLAGTSTTPAWYLYREDAQQAPIWGMKRTAISSWMR